MGQPKPAHYSQFGGSLREDFCSQVLPREKFTPRSAAHVRFGLNFPSWKLEPRVFLTRPPIAFQANSFAIFSLLSEARRYSLPPNRCLPFKRTRRTSCPFFLASFFLSLSLSLLFPSRLFPFLPFFSPSRAPSYPSFYFISLLFFRSSGTERSSRRYSIINPAE